MAVIKREFTWKKAYMLLGILLAALIVRAFYGIDATDETFYFALARRFYQGDSLLIDEWFPAQLIGIVLLPFYQAYAWLHGSEEGVILCARICYAVFAVLTAAYMMHVFRKNGENAVFSFFSALLFAVYTRAGIASFSYYNLGLLTFLLTMLLFLDGKHTQTSWVKWLMSGICFSISVLCMPYMIGVFGCMAVGYWIRHKKLTLEKDGMFFCLGIMGAAGLFLIFYGKDLLAGISNIPYLFMDPEHQGTVFDKTGGTILYVLFTYLKYTWPLYLATSLASAFFRIKKIQSAGALQMLRIVLYLEFFLQALYSRTFFEGGIVCAFLFLALQIQLANRKIREKELEWYFLFPGLLFGLAWINGSDLSMRVLNMGVLMADVWALKILERDMETRDAGVRWMRKLSVAVLFAVLLANRFFDVYRDSVVWKMDTQIACGSMKGIFTTAERAGEYEAVVQDLREYTRETDRIAVQGLNPWIYLEAPARCGTFSVWDADPEDQRNRSYYEKYPENQPTVIYLLRPDRAVYRGWRWGSHGSASQGTGTEQAEGCLKELIEQMYYEKTETDTGIFYRRMSAAGQ